MMEPAWPPIQSNAMVVLLEAIMAASSRPSIDFTPPPAHPLVKKQEGLDPTREGIRRWRQRWTRDPILQN
jgi:hypothetical protein